MRFPLKTKLVLLGVAFSFLLARSTFGGDEGGISGSGGGNSARDKLIEEYAFSPYQTEAGKIVREKLALLERELPAFGKLLREHFEKLTFYAIPERIKSLPSEQTGLVFKNQQLAIHRDGEVFADAELLARQTDLGKAKLFLHEGFMALLAEKKSRDVRKVVTKLFEPGFSVKALQITLAEANFGPNLSSSDITALSKGETKRYLKSVGRLVISASRACEGAASLGELQALLAEAPRSALVGDQLQSPFRTSTSVFGYEHALAQGWEQPISRNRTDARNLSLKLLLTDTEGGAPPLPVASELYKLVLVENAQTLAKLPEQDLRLRVTGENSSLYEAEAAKLRETALLKLAAQPAFINLIALNGMHHEIFADDNFNEDLAKISGKGRAAFALLTEAQKRSRELANFSESERRALLCHSAKALKKALSAAAQGEAPASLEMSEGEPRAGSTINPAR